MRNKWFGDEKDLVKWTELISLAKQNDVDKILQVAYHRDDTPKILNDGIHDIDPNEVIRNSDQNQKRGTLSGLVQFFSEHRENIRKEWNDYNDAHSLDTIEEFSDVCISVFDKYLQDRKEYRNAVIDRIRELSQSKIVFLDPDTGIEPSNCKKAHVQKQEIRKYYDAIDDGDYLALFQHARQGKSNWEQEIQDQITGLLPDNTEVSRMGDRVKFFL